MKSINTVLWDVDDTLLDFGKSQRYAIQKTFEQFHLEITEEIIHSYIEINDRYWKKIERGEISKEEVLTLRFQTLFERHAIPFAEVEQFQSCYQKLLGSVYYYRDDSIELCRILQGQVRQYVVTNGIRATQVSKLSLSGLDLVMDDIFISDEIGFVKPQTEYFAACSLKIPEYDPSRTMIVGDSLTSDMLGGNNSKITTCWYNPEQIKNDLAISIDYEITNLWQIRDILGR